MAPEVWAGDPYSTPCDIYSFGICAIEMINRRERWSELRFDGRGREIPGAWRRITAQIASHGLKPEIGDCEATLKNIVSMCVEVRFEQRKG